MEVSYSEISTFKWCRRKWDYACVQRLADTTLDWNLLLGSAIHYGLERFLSNSEDMHASVKFWWTQMHAELQKSHTFTAEENITLHEQFELSLAMADAYMAWSKNNDAFHVVAIEYAFAVPIPGTQDGIFKGLIDGVIEVDGGLWLLEHKTRKKFDAIEDLALDDQTSLYQWALTYLVRSGQFFGYDPDTEVLGTYFTMLKKEALAMPKLLKNGMALSQDKSASTSYELFRQALQLYGFAETGYETTLERLQLQGHPTIRRFMYVRPEDELVRVVADLISVYRAMKYAQENEDACYPTHSTSCRYCSFFNLCKTDRQGGDVQTILATFVQRPSREQARLALLEK